MSPVARMERLAAAGVRLALSGRDLRYQTAPGVSIGPYVEEIRQHKTALLRELLQREIVSCAAAAPESFDRERYDRLWQQWSALPDPEAEAAAMVPALEAGWTWLTSNPGHPEHEAFLDRWLAKLRAYEQTYRDGDD